MFPLVPLSLIDSVRTGAPRSVTATGCAVPYSSRVRGPGTEAAEAGRQSIKIIVAAIATAASTFPCVSFSASSSAVAQA